MRDMLIVVFINLIGLTLIYFIGELLVGSPYKKTISATLMTVSTILSIGVILFVQFSSQNQMYSENPTDMPNIYLLRASMMSSIVLLASRLLYISASPSC